MQSIKLRKFFLTAKPADASSELDLPFRAASNSMVSITIVSYNGAADIRRCMESLQAQTLRNFEVIVVDNASKDDSVAIFREFPWVRLVINSVNTGFSAAQNQGIREAQGEFIVCLNLDTRAEPTFLEELMAAIQLDNGIGSVCPKILHMDHNGVVPDPPLIDCTGIYATPDMRQHNRGSRSVDRGQYDEPCYVFGYTGAAAMFRRAVLDDVSIDGMFVDEDFFAFREDSDLSWRMQLAGWSCLYTPYSVIYHRRHVFEDNRRAVSPIINLHSTKNRFLMRINNITPRLYRRCFGPMTIRDLGVIAYVLLRERSSLPGLLFVIREWKRLVEKRRAIQSKRRVGEDNVADWFSFEPVTRPLSPDLAKKLLRKRAP